MQKYGLVLEEGEAAQEAFVVIYHSAEVGNQMVESAAYFDCTYYVFANDFNSYDEDYSMLFVTREGKELRKHLRGFEGVRVLTQFE